MLMVPNVDVIKCLNVNGAKVKIGIHKGRGVKIKEDTDWLQLVHCFNHWLELLLKDASDNSAFKEIWYNKNLSMKFLYIFLSCSL